jgi:hypothetical protein
VLNSDKPLKELLMRPDLQASMVLCLGQSEYHHAFIMFSNNRHHWGIFQTQGKDAGWHHYDDCANGGGHMLVNGQ